jgi:hypothetical protein
VKSKPKIILATAVGTTIAWVVLIVSFFWIASSGDPDVIVRFPNPGHFESAELEVQKGEYVIDLVSSNLTTSATSVMFSRTSRPPERVWFANRKPN